MLIDYDILNHFGSTKARIKQVLTAQAGTEDYEIRQRWEEKIESRVHEGAEWGLKNYQFYYASDMAFDTNIISKELIPLSLYAQNKITLKDAAKQLKNISAETAAKFCTFKDDDAVAIDVPAFHKVVVALVRSFITRRTAALSARYVKLTPFLKYEPLGTSYPTLLKGDVLTQRIEMITNAYGYRHDLIQRIRDMLLYGFSVEFVDCAWEKEKTLRKKKSPEAFSGDEMQIESVVAKEGVPFKGVHPTRLFYDMSQPLASINTDTGCSYIGHWNLIPFRTVKDNPVYFNRDKIEYDTSFASTLVGHSNYFELYSADAPVNFPRPSEGVNFATYNDRDVQAGFYSSNSEKDDDTSILLTQYFERVVPKDVGLGDYPHPVWVRLVVAADKTVVYGEFLPFTPAIYYGYNSNDGKVLNMSFAHDAMAFQDQTSNILTSFLLAQKAALIKIISLDIDQISDPDHVKLIRSIVAGESLYTAPLLIEHKGVQSAEMGQDKRRIVEINETQALLDPARYISTILQLIGMAERLLGISSNEQGQSEQREISATENANIAVTTSTSLAFMGQGVDEALAAKKRLLYEGLMARGEAVVRVPVAGRYTAATVKEAGFELVEGSVLAPAGVASRVTVKGDKSALEYDYSFSNRDGSERPSNVKSAEVMTLLFQQFAQIPGVLDSMGKDGLYDFLNAVLRLSGAPVDINFKVDDGVPAPAVAPSPAEVPAVMVGAAPTDATGDFLVPPT